MVVGAVKKCLKKGVVDKMTMVHARTEVKRKAKRANPKKKTEVRTTQKKAMAAMAALAAAAAAERKKRRGG